MLQRLLVHHPATLWAVMLGITLPWGRLTRLRELVLVLSLLLAPPLGRTASAIAGRIGTARS